MSAYNGEIAKIVGLTFSRVQQIYRQNPRGKSRRRII